ncbi:AsmA-like C-terminal domain-containing protein [Luteithermobacter gelatinilyticus]|uniref:YhdP family protein n=1 Tax=Luteithermobacter gelatinilyticus TaxID=2582913 RepID=UPI001106A71E|nr:AsmA-like C-terminal domain-containing protein [Luteithermobacter gelatinilyticus]
MAVLLLVFVWRISLGPVAFDWAGPYLKKALASSSTDLEYDFRDVVLTWRPASDKYYDTAGLEIRFLDLSLKDTTNGLALNIPQAGIQFSALGLLRGVLAPVSAEFSSLSFEMILPREIWNNQDAEPFERRLQKILNDFQNSPRLLPRLTRELLSSPDPAKPAGYLKEVIFRDTHIAILDERSGNSWEIPNAVLDMRRAEDGLVAILEGDLLRAEARDLTADDLMTLHLSLAHSNRRQDGIIQLRFSGFNPSRFSAGIEGLRELHAQNVPLNGIIDVEITRDLNLGSVVFELESGEGTINPGRLYDTPVALNQAIISGHYAGAEQTLFIDQFRLDLDQIHLKGDGLLYGTMDRPGIILDTTVEHMPFTRLKTYWPEGLAEGARSWIKRNIDAGIVTQGAVEIDIRPEMWDQERLPETIFSFNFDFEGIDAHYLRPMPFLKTVSGRAELTLSRFNLIADQGYIDDVLVHDARLLFSDIDQKGAAQAHMTIPLSGRLESILRIIDHDPLGYPGKYGIEEGSITGQAEALLRLDFPLIRDLALKDVDFDVKATVNALSIPQLSDSLSITDGEIDLFVNGDELEATGDILLNGVKFTALWRETFKSSASEAPTFYQITGELNGSDWDAFHLPFEAFVEGPAEIQLKLSGRGAKLTAGEGEINLTRPRTVFPPLGWIKEKDTPATASFRLDFGEREMLRIKDISLTSNSLRATAEMLLVEDQTVHFAIPKLVMVDTNLSFEMMWNAEKQNYLATLEAPQFDATALIDMMVSSGPSSETLSLPDFDLTGVFGKVKAKNGVVLDRADLKVRYAGNDFRDVKFHAKWAGAAQSEEEKYVEVTLIPGPEDRILNVTSNDAGEALRGFGIFKLGAGGKMELKADFIRHDDGISIGGKTRVKDFKVVDSPGFAQLLTEEKFAKAREELKKEGLKFDDFEMEFRQYNGILEISNGTAKGNMLGMTLSGSVDQTYNEVSLSGTIVPAYGINSLLSNIPLVGAILTGGKDQGVFAATYRMSGTMDNVTIDVNPLAALAPGILRNIFKVFEGGKKKTLREEAEELQDISPDVNKGEIEGP